MTAVTARTDKAGSALTAGAGVTASAYASQSLQTGRWTETEKTRFLRALSIYGKGAFRWKRIAAYVGTRTAVQCKTHHQKLVHKAEKEYMKRRTAAQENKYASTKEDCVVEYRMVLETAKRYRKGDPSVPGATFHESAASPSNTAATSTDSAGAPPQDGKPSAQYAQQRIPQSSMLVFNPSYGRWTETEKKLFDEAMVIYGKGRWKLVAKYVGTRTSTQCKTHHQKVVEKETKQTDRDASSVVDDDRFADAEEDDGTPGREEAIVAKVLCDYRNDRPCELDPFDFPSAAAALSGELVLAPAVADHHYNHQHYHRHPGTTDFVPNGGGSGYGEFIPGDIPVQHNHPSNNGDAGGKRLQFEAENAFYSAPPPGGFGEPITPAVHTAPAGGGGGDGATRMGIADHHPTPVGDPMQMIPAGNFNGETIAGNAVAAAANNFIPVVKIVHSMSI